MDTFASLGASLSFSAATVDPVAVNTVAPAAPVIRLVRNRRRFALTLLLTFSLTRFPFTMSLDYRKILYSSLAVHPEIFFLYAHNLASESACFTVKLRMGSLLQILEETRHPRQNVLIKEIPLLKNRLPILAP